MTRESKQEFWVSAFKAFMANSQDMIFVKNKDLVFVGVSKSFAALFGCGDASELAGKTDYDLFDAEIAARHIRDDRRVLESGVPIVNIIEAIPDKRGNTKYSSVSKFIITDGGGVLGLYGIGRDVTEKTELDILRRRATTDALTGLLNRESTIEQIKDCIEGYGAGGTHALLFIDLDCFKQVNDRMGHPVGDVVLKDTARKIRDVFRRDDIVGRVGGDEFLVLLKNVESEKDVRGRTNEIFDSLAIQGSRSNLDPCVTCSIGISMYMGDGRPFDELYEEADRAMYIAKSCGLGRVAFYK